MAVLSQDDILKEMKGGTFRPVYLLMGEEPYPIDVVADYVEQNAMAEADRTFNQTVIYGRDTTGRKIGLECDQYPTFAERRVVIVREAQATSQIGDLETYVSHCLPSTILVLCHKYKALDKRLKLYKAIEKAGGAIMETKKLYDNQMPHWISSFANKRGFSIEDRAADLLAEHVGTSMTDAAKAIEKVRAAVGPSLKTITVDMVSDNVGISKEYNAFELRDALFRKDKAKALMIVKAMGQNEKAFPVQAIIAALYNGFDHLFTYCFAKATTRSEDEAVKAAMAVGERSPFMVSKNFGPASRLYTATDCMRITTLLAEYDMRSKGFNWPDTSSRDMLVDIVTRCLSIGEPRQS